MVRHHHHRHHHNHYAARMARLRLDAQLLALQPTQQLVYEDTFAHPTKTFNEQLPANLIQQYGIDGQQFTTAFNQLNLTLAEYSKEVTEQTTRYMYLLLGSIFLGILTCGLLLVLVIPLMIYQIMLTQKATSKFTQEIQPKMNQAVQSLNNAQLKANGFEWLLIRVSTGIVLRLVYSAPLSQVGIQQPQYIQQQPQQQPQYQYQNVQQPTQYNTTQQPVMNLQPVTIDFKPPYQQV